MKGTAVSKIPKSQKSRDLHPNKNFKEMLPGWCVAIALHCLLHVAERARRFATKDRSRRKPRADSVVNKAHTREVNARAQTGPTKSAGGGWIYVLYVVHA